MSGAASRQFDQDVAARQAIDQQQFKIAPSKSSVPQLNQVKLLVNIILEYAIYLLFRGHQSILYTNCLFKLWFLEKLEIL